VWQRLLSARAYGLLYLVLEATERRRSVCICLRSAKIGDQVPPTEDGLYVPVLLLQFPRFQMSRVQDVEDVAVARDPLGLERAPPGQVARRSEDDGDSR